MRISSRQNQIDLGNSCDLKTIAVEKAQAGESLL